MLAVREKERQKRERQTETEREVKQKSVAPEKRNTTGNKTHNHYKENREKVGKMSGGGGEKHCLFFLIRAQRLGFLEAELKKGIDFRHFV